MPLGYCPQYYEPEYGETFERRRARLQLVADDYRPPDAWSASSYQPDPPCQLYYPEYDSRRASIWYWPCRPVVVVAPPPAQPRGSLRLVTDEYAPEPTAPVYRPDALLYGISYLEMAAEAEWMDDDELDGYMVELHRAVAGIEQRRRRNHLRLI